MQGPSNHVNTPSPFPNSSTSPGAMPPSSDRKWAPANPWPSTSSSSRAPSPAQPAAHSHQLPANVPVEQVIQLLAMASQGRLLPSPFAPAQLTSSAETSTSRPTTPETPKRGKRIPRPPNAFMLYRSNLIKTGRIPRNIEQRQQNISRVAGECWNLLSEAEKERWHTEAAKAMADHQIKHPDYKFSPARKSSRRKATPDEDGAVDKDVYVRHLREKYVGIIGDAKPPPRPRKPKSRRGVGSEPPAARSLPGSLHPSPSSSPFRVPSAPPCLTASPGPQSFTHGSGSISDYSLDALGIMPLGLPIDLLAQHVAANLLQSAGGHDGDTTPKAQTFGDLSLPPQSKFNASGSSTGLAAPKGDVSTRAPVAGPSHQGEGSQSAPLNMSQWDAFLRFPDPLTAQTGSTLECPDDPDSLYAYGEFSNSMESFASALFSHPE